MIEIFVCGDTYIESVEKNGPKCHASSFFNDMLVYSESADFAIANLEAPITSTNTAIEKTGPSLKSTVDCLRVLKQANFSLVTLANNHIMDYGTEGLASTLELCKQFQLDTVGASLNGQDAALPFVFEKAGQKIAILNFAENEFATTQGEEAGANPINPISNYYDIKKAKGDNDCVLVIVHGGREYYNLPSPRFRDLLRFYVECGADAVLAHHTHCFGGYEVYNNSPIFYGLGNFLFQSQKKSSVGLGVQLLIEPHKIGFNVIPFISNGGGATAANLKRLTESEEQEFFSEVAEINSIIQNDVELHRAWQKYILSQQETYKRDLFVKNSWLKKMARRGMIPSNFFYNRKFSTLLLNLIRCETHREISVDVLKLTDKSKKVS